MCCQSKMNIHHRIQRGYHETHHHYPHQEECHGMPLISKKRKMKMLMNLLEHLKDQVTAVEEKISEIKEKK